MLRYQSLDAMRGVFALMIVLLHLPIINSFFDNAIIRGGFIFVDFFFVLSGFVISFRYMRSITAIEEAGRFIVSRIARLWPLQAAVMLGFLGIEIVKYAISAAGLFPGSAGLSQAEMVTAAQQLFLLQAFSNETSYFWNFPSWSISAELAAYTLFALACTLGRPAGIIFAAFCTLVALAVGVGLLDLGFGAMFGHGLFSAVAGFFIGVLVCILHQTEVGKAAAALPAAMATLLEAGFVVIIAALAAYRSALPFPALLEPILFGLTILLFAAEKGLISRLFLTRPLQLLGGLSYTIYMTHILVLAVMGLLARVSEKLVGLPLRTTSGIEGATATFLDFGSPLAGNLASLATVLAVLGIALLANRHIERPSIALARRIISQGRPRQPAPSGSGPTAQ